MREASIRRWSLKEDDLAVECVGPRVARISPPDLSGTRGGMREEGSCLEGGLGNSCPMTRRLRRGQSIWTRSGHGKRSVDGLDDTCPVMACRRVRFFFHFPPSSWLLAEEGSHVGWPVAFFLYILFYL